MDIVALIVSIIALLIAGASFMWNYKISKTSLKIVCNRIEEERMDKKIPVQVRVINQSRFNTEILNVNLISNHTKNKILMYSMRSFRDIYSNESTTFYSEFKGLPLDSHKQYFFTLFIKPENYNNKAKLEFKTPEKTFTVKIKPSTTNRNQRKD